MAAGAGGRGALIRRPAGDACDDRDMRAAFACVMAASALLTTACGGAGAVPSGPSPAANRAAQRLLAQGTTVLPTPGPTGHHADASAVRVIRAWSDALRAGHVRAAAEYFTVPSEMINGIGPGGTVPVLSIRSLHAAEEANASLPCGARLISTDQRGPYVNALFRLTGRAGPGGSGCSGGTGQTARTNFLIADGRIVEWLRAPDDPSDNGSNAPGGSAGGGPSV